MNRYLFWTVQFVFVVALTIAFLLAPSEAKRLVKQELTGKPAVQPVEITRTEPIRIEPLYDRPEMVSDEDLAAVLWQVRPKFKRKGLRPNLVEHAIRTWSKDAVFNDPAVLSGKELEKFLLDNSTFMLSWGENAMPLLEDRKEGIGVNWGRVRSVSVHHDHMLACVSEAGVHLDEPVFLPTQRRATVKNIVQESLRDFRLDERETEWTAMAFGLWLPPTKQWRSADGRLMSFDLLAERLIRGRLEKGVCSGTHRVYSLILLWRLDEKFDILSDPIQKKVYDHLAQVRDLITASQFEDGHWPSNWDEGARALSNPRDDKLKDKVIATGHHLEWLAIAPQQLHPPRENIDRAARWIIETTKQQSEEEIFLRYTFFSHVGSALALWRKTHPSDFWRQWIRKHPDYKFDPPGKATSVGKATSAPKAD